HIYYYLLYRQTAYTLNPLSLHDALPIYGDQRAKFRSARRKVWARFGADYFERESQRRAGPDRRVSFPGRSLELPATSWIDRASGDRKSTRLNSSHRTISYAVFCLKKKNE